MSIQSDLEAVERKLSSRSKAYKQATDKLPDGLVVSGWIKQTISGDSFWIKISPRSNKYRYSPDLLSEAGQKETDAVLLRYGIPIPSC